jgi:BirA family biotin operon repressor/biotin-[acetyl-CoA-carboxylase] ligase
VHPTRREILDAISGSRVRGPQLAERLDVTRAAVWKHVDSLREAGFEIDSNDDGYRLVSVPEFGGAAVEYGLQAPFDIEYHDSVPSTNDRARELAKAGESGVVVLADEQTGGKGRLDREWASPSGGVWLSILLRPDVPPAHAPTYTLAAAVATTRAAREAGVEASIKWPNDVVVPEATESPDGAKLAGILTEMEGEADRVSWLVVGIGVNANVDPETLPQERAATSIREHAGELDRRRFTQRLLETFHELRGEPEDVLTAWREHASTLGQRVRVETPQGDVTGTAIDITFPGTLIVDTGEGRVEVSAGDCEHLRPDD